MPENGNAIVMRITCPDSNSTWSGEVRHGVRWRDVKAAAERNGMVLMSDWSSIDKVARDKGYISKHEAAVVAKRDHGLVEPLARTLSVEQMLYLEVALQREFAVRVHRARRAYVTAHVEEVRGRAEEIEAFRTLMDVLGIEPAEDWMDSQEVMYQLREMDAVSAALVGLDYDAGIPEEPDEEEVPVG